MSANFNTLYSLNADRSLTPTHAGYEYGAPLLDSQALQSSYVIFPNKNVIIRQVWETQRIILYVKINNVEFQMTVARWAPRVPSIHTVLCTVPLDPLPPHCLLHSPL